MTVNTTEVSELAGKFPKLFFLAAIEINFIVAAEGSRNINI